MIFRVSIAAWRESGRSGRLPGVRAGPLRHAPGPPLALLSCQYRTCPAFPLRFHPCKRLLASVAGPHAEVCVWDWDYWGQVKCLNRINRAEGVRYDDVAWHPSDDILAIVGGGMAIELWSEGQLLKTLGTAPIPGRTRTFTSRRNPRGSGRSNACPYSPSTCRHRMACWQQPDATAKSSFGSSTARLRHPGPASKPVTRAFLDNYKLIDSMASDDQFRTTDGKRWYDFETIDEDELDADAPPWAQIAKWRREWEKLSE